MHHLAQQRTSYVLCSVMRMVTRFRPYGKVVATVGVNMYPTLRSWGGSSVFVHQFAAVLRRCRVRTVFDLRGHVDVILVIDPRDDLQNKAFGMEEIRAYRRHNPQVQIVHRVNECDQRKGTAFMDDLLRQTNDIADYTVFISEWLRDYFVERWFDSKRPHSVIYNGADPAVFHPVGGAIYDDREPLRLVTHHWSSNPMKGFPVYKMLDDMIADGIIENVELWVIGNWPNDLTWRAARTFPPSSGKRLAALLRQCHVYITGSLWEPCGMHHVEGAQCGLPLLYHENGGGIVEAGQQYGIGFREETLAAVIDAMRSRYREMRRLVFGAMPDGVRMATDYVKVVQRLLAERS